MVNARALRLLSFVLVAVGACYLCYSVPHLFQEARDYHIRWLEEHYVFRGKNPADVFLRLHAENQHLPVPVTSRDNTFDKDLDPDITAINGPYPLYAYFTAALLTWPPSLEWGRIYSGALNLIVFAGMLIWVYRLGAGGEYGFGLFLASSFFAVNSIATTLYVGQYCLFVMAALIGAGILDGKNRWFWAGLCLALAMIKPSMAVPFMIPFLITGRWKMLAVTGIYLITTSLIMWPVMKTSPLESLGQVVALTAIFGEGGYSLNNLFEWTGFTPENSLRIAAIISLSLTFSLTWFWRRSSIWTLFAIAAMGSRFWTYHSKYDNVVLIFLLLPLAVRAWRSQRRLPFAAYFILGISLWMPGRLADHDWWDVVQGAIWVGALVVFLYEEPKDATREKIADDRDLMGTVDIYRKN